VQAACYCRLAALVRCGYETVSFCFFSIILFYRQRRTVLVAAVPAGIDVLVWQSLNMDSQSPSPVDCDSLNLPRYAQYRDDLNQQSMPHYGSRHAVVFRIQSAEQENQSLTTI
jgi:hypothetical protein